VKPGTLCPKRGPGTTCPKWGPELYFQSGTENGP